MSRTLPDVPLEATMMKLRVEDTRLRAEVNHALHNAGIVRQRWLTQRSCRMLCRLGRRLVDVGEQLKQYDVPQAIPAGGLQEV
jgi:hypothetical protein